MDRQEIASKVIATAKEVFNYDGEITAQTKASEIKTWDSMNQIRFIAELEGFFSVKFKMKDLISFNSVGSVIAALEKLL
jgi:acyl carrier protein